MSPRGAGAGAERFAAKARRRRLRRIVLGLAGLAAVAAMGAVAWLIGWSNVTAVERAEIAGASGEVSQTVRDTADVPLGVPLIRIDTDAIAERVSSIPDIASVEVRRGWLTTVEIDVTLREPAASVQSDDLWWSVDREGVLFAPSATRDLAVVELVADTGPDVGAVASRVAALDAVAGLPDDVAALLAAVEASSEAAIELVFSDQRRVLWGTAADGERKAEVLRVLMAEVPDAERYDVSAPEFPAVSQ